jgi:hypothetical protein
MRPVSSGLQQVLLFCSPLTSPAERLAVHPGGLSGTDNMDRGGDSYRPEERPYFGPIIWADHIRYVYGLKSDAIVKILTV